MEPRGLRERPLSLLMLKEGLKRAAGAQAAGLRAILVRTGKFRPADLEQGIEPDLVIDSIVDLPAVLAKRASS